MNLIGIHTGSIPNKVYNKGIFIKPIIKDFFKYLEGKKIYYDEQFEKKNEILIKINEFNDKTKLISKKDNINDNELNKNFNNSLFGNFVFFMGFILGIFFNILIEFFFEFSDIIKDDIYLIIIIIYIDINNLYFMHNISTISF